MSINHGAKAILNVGTGRFLSGWWDFGKKIADGADPAAALNSFAKPGTSLWKQAKDVNNNLMFKVDKATGKQILDSNNNPIPIMQFDSSNLDWGRAIGSTWAAGTAASVGLGAVRGAFTDTDGDFDMPGIPFI